MSGARLVRVGSPFNAVELAEIDIEQSADVDYFAHADHPPTKLIRLSHTSWAFSSITFGSVILPPAAPVVTASTPNTDSHNGGASYYPRNRAYAIASINDATGQTSVQGAYTTVSNDLNLKGNVNSISWSAVAGATRYAIYAQDNASNTFGYIGTSAGTSFEDNNGGLTPDYTDTAPIGTNPFSGAGNYPSTVCLHQQRVIWGRSRNKPNGLWMSQSADPENMNVTRPTKDDDAITYALVSRTVNSVNQLGSFTTGLIAFSSGALFSITGAQGPDDPITPTSINAKLAVSRGASRLDPIILDNTGFYTTQQGGYVRTVGFSFELDGNKSDNVSIFSPDLFDGYSIISWAYAEFPLSCVWAVRSDGKLLCFTWEQEQGVWGWTFCETDGTVESVAAIPENGESRVYLSVWRTIGGQPVRFIERMATALDVLSDQSCYTDCSVTTSFDVPDTIVTHLDHLEGCAVAAVADGSYIPGLMVVSGQVTLPVASSMVTVGLPYDCRVQTLPLVFQGQAGVNVGKRQMLGKAAIQVQNTRGILAGPSFDKLLEVKPRSVETYGSANHQINDVVELDMQPSWTAQQSVCLSFPYPVPMTLLAAYLEPIVSPDA